jgi:glycosyltransferase involved in cell wall biosynthesis
VSTTLGAEGLAAVDGENCLLRDDPTEFALAIKAVLDQPAQRARLERNARATAENIYAWDVVGREMLERYLALATARSAS